MPFTRRSSLSGTFCVPVLYKCLLIVSVVLVIQLIAVTIRTAKMTGDSSEAC